jgi:drug/metabolite transporter (DMT)-like permease
VEIESAHLMNSSPSAADPTFSLRSRQLRDFVLLLVGVTAIGNSSVLFRLAETAPAAAAFWRMVFALPVFVVWTVLEKRHAPVGIAARTDASVIWASFLAGLSFAADLTLSNIALGLTTMTSFIILVHLAPVVVVLVAWFWFREKPTVGILAALVLSIIGAALLVQSGRAGAAPRNALLGDIASVAAAFGYAGFILATRRARLIGGAGLVSLISASSCAMGCLAFSLLLGESLWPQSAYGALMLAVMGVVCHAFGQGLSAYAVGSLGASVTSIVLVYGVAVTVIGGWLFFGEVPNLLQLSGGVLVLAAVIICRPK